VPVAARAVPIYGTFSCPVAAACRDADRRHGGFAYPDAIWLVVWPEASGGSGGQAWAAVHPDTGELISGDGPPTP
jgi:hypothetical protein